MSKKIDGSVGFGERFLKAADNAGLPPNQTPIAVFLGVRKQNVDAWMNGTLPRADILFAIADKFKVDARWLATGQTQSVNSGVIAHTKANKILAVVETLLHTDDERLEEVVGAVEAVAGDNGATRQPRRAKRARS